MFKDFKKILGHVFLGLYAQPNIDAAYFKGIIGLGPDSKSSDEIKFKDFLRD